MYPPTIVVSDTLQPPPEAPSPSHPLTSSPSHPPLSPHDESLLHALSACNFNFFELAREKLLTLPQLIAWATSEPIQHYIAELKKLARLTLELRHDQARTAAIDALELVAKTTDDLTEKRRAATALLRKLDTIPQARQPDPLDSEDDDDEDSGLQDSGPGTSPDDDPPDPSLVPGQLVTNCIDEADTAESLLATLRPHMARDIKVCGLPWSDDPAVRAQRTTKLAEFVALRAKNPRARWGLVNPCHDVGAYFNYTIMMPDGARPTLTFHLKEIDDRWQLTTLDRYDCPREKPDSS